tara:strand:- start:1437 stop:1679 length:243 start_codon:yes stop_codon:yes gene_type:complete
MFQHVHSQQDVVWCGVRYARTHAVTVTHPGLADYRRQTWIDAYEAIKAVPKSRSLSAKPKVLGGSASELDDGYKALASRG